jgi:peroxiredoxin
MTQHIETIAMGQTIPQVNFQMKLDDGIDTFSTTDYFKDILVVLFVVPGAFTPTCSAKHLPGFVKLADKFKAAGIDKIACMAVNDAHVMRAWAEANGAIGIIDMIADFHTEMSDALGLTRDTGPILGRRAARCAMLIDGGVVQSIFMEEPGAFGVSSAEHVLASLSADSC